MNTRAVAVTAVAFALGLVLAACGTKSGDSKSSGSSGSSATPASASKYDAGPRAAEQPIDESRVAAGETLFKQKGCSACHAFGTKLSGPDLNGVTKRRTALWMENQILHPEIMTKEDPISHELLTKYMLQMTNQHLTSDEARAVIEYFKHHDHEAAEAH